MMQPTDDAGVPLVVMGLPGARVMPWGFFIEHGATPEQVEEVRHAWYSVLRANGVQSQAGRMMIVPGDAHLHTVDSPTAEQRQRIKVTAVRRRERIAKAGRALGRIVRYLVPAIVIVVVTFALIVPDVVEAFR
jgi:hypothetical protein